MPGEAEPFVIDTHTGQSVRVAQSHSQLAGIHCGSVSKANNFRASNDKINVDEHKSGRDAVAFSEHSANEEIRCQHYQVENVAEFEEAAGDNCLAQLLHLAMERQGFAHISQILDALVHGGPSKRKRWFDVIFQLGSECGR